MLTVIIPTCDRPQLLCRAIESVVAQSLPDWELLVVDDGTLPITEELIEAHQSHPQIRFLRTSGRLGVSAARNAGIGAALGEIICFLDDDDELEPTFLAEVSAGFARTGCDFLWTGRQHIDKMKMSTTTTIWQEKAVQADLGFVTEIAASCGLSVSRATFARCGGFDTALRTSEDRDLVLRFIQQGMRYAVIPKPLVKVYNEGIASLSRLRKSPGRSSLSASDDEVVVERYGTLIYADGVLARNYLEALAGKYYDAGDSDGYYSVLRRCAKHRVFSFRLFRRGVKVVFKSAMQSRPANSAEKL